jgi:DNA-binding XRE family transcriptional regulator
LLTAGRSHHAPEHDSIPWHYAIIWVHSSTKLIIVFGLTGNVHPVSSTLQAALIKAVRAERAALGISQAELGARLGWSRQMIAKVEAGDRQIAFHELPELCVALEMTLLSILSRASPSDRRALGVD